MSATTVELGGTEYVILPKREYVRLARRLACAGVVQLKR